MAIEGIIGKKVGMTQVFAEDGALVPVTVIQAGPCLVVQKKTTEVDGYNAVQVGLVEKVSNRRVTGAMRGHYEKPASRRCARSSSCPTTARRMSAKKCRWTSSSPATPST